MQKRFFVFPFLFAGFVLLAAGAVMLLWNAILPEIIGVKTITFWQALGLLILSRILLGGYRGPGNRRSQHNAWRTKWQNMSVEEREQFRNEWKKRCGR